MTYFFDRLIHTNMKTITQLKKWMKKRRSARVDLANYFGYRTTNTIDQWVTRGYIPEKIEKKVASYIKRYPNADAR